MAFVKLRVLGDSGGKGEHNCRMSFAFLAVFEEDEQGEGRRSKSKQKVEEERTIEKRTARCANFANAPSVFAVFVDWKNFI